MPHDSAAQIQKSASSERDARFRNGGEQRGAHASGAAGFLGSESYVTKAFGVEVDGRTNVKTEAGRYGSSMEKIYVCGDMHIGQSLVVRAITEGRNVAREVDEALMGYTNL